jgi:hypothetical protein
MRRRSVRSTLAALCLLGASTFAAARADQPAADRAAVEARARAAAAAAQARSGDSDSLQRTYVTPGLSGQPISTVDGSHSVTANLACQKTASLLEILIQPVASGDIGTIRIAHDSDLDGIMDQVSTVPVPVSGICANGVISCQRGSWNQCHYLRWDVDAARAIKLTEVDMPDLAGCYCVNASCGANLVLGNLSSVLKDLGGGVVGALTTADPRIGVAQAVIDGPLIRYVGAQATACTASPAVSQTQYAANPPSLLGDATAASTSSSVFQTLVGSPAGSGTAAQTSSCTIERQVVVNSPSPQAIIDRTAGGYATIPTSDAGLDFLMGSPSDNTLNGGSCAFFDFRMTLSVGDPDRIVSARLPHFYADDWAAIRVDGQWVASTPSAWSGDGLPPGKCDQKRTSHGYPDIDLKPYLTRGTHEIWMHVAVGGEGEAMAQVHVDLDTACHSAETLRDLCAGPAANPHCRLVQEVVDGVTTVTGGVHTGLTPLPQTRILGDVACPFTLTRDFFLRDRRYQCITTSDAQAKPDLSRAAYIIDHSTETLLADRQTAADGTVFATQRAFALPPRPHVASCEAVCKTRRPKANNAAAPAGVMASQQNDPSGWDVSYHVCRADTVCPAETGEEVVADCGCLDDFPEAVVLMQTVRLAGADTVCTAVQR